MRSTMDNTQVNSSLAFVRNHRTHLHLVRHDSTSGKVRFRKSTFVGTKLALVVCRSVNHNRWYNLRFPNNLHDSLQWQTLEHRPSAGPRTPPMKRGRPRAGRPRHSFTWLLWKYLSQTHTWERLTSLAQLISNSFPFHDREARSISPSLAMRRPSEICIKPAVCHLFFPLLS